MRLKTLYSFASGRRWSACLSAHGHEFVQLRCATSVLTSQGGPMTES